MPQLDQPCSKHFTYRQLIECCETWHSSSIDNLPLADQSWQALADLATYILDPVYKQFGAPKITYGFCSPPLATARKKLAKEQGVLPSIYPILDQHSCFEKNRKGDTICSRGGAACDVYVPDTSSLPPGSSNSSPLTGSIVMDTTSPFTLAITATLKMQSSA